MKYAANIVFKLLKSFNLFFGTYFIEPLSVSKELYVLAIFFSLFSLIYFTCMEFFKIREIVNFWWLVLIQLYNFKRLLGTENWKNQNVGFRDVFGLTDEQVEKNDRPMN